MAVVHSQVLGIPDGQGQEPDFHGPDLFWLHQRDLFEDCGPGHRQQADHLRFAFYVLNAIMVGIDIGLYFRNRKLDTLAAGRDFQS
jgi:hypothetical protein